MSDAAAREYATDPRRNVVLEASAGTGKTRVLVERYVNLLRAGVEPEHILAITFTRKAAAEMRERILDRLREAGRLSEIDRARWQELKPRLGDITVSTIDAFCLSLLREFPLEADVDPGFDLADETEIPRLVSESLDHALRISRAAAKVDDDVALLFAQLGERRLRSGLAALLDRRLVAPRVLGAYLARGPRNLTAASACLNAAIRLRDLFAGVPGGLSGFIASGPTRSLQFAMIARDIRGLAEGQMGSFEARPEQAAFRVVLDRLRGYFLTQDGKPREKAFSGTGFKAADCGSDASWRAHREKASNLAPAVAEAVLGFRRDLNVVLSRGVWRVFAVALKQYERTLESKGLIDFSGVLQKAVNLLKEMDEFAESRFQLEARYRHVLVDEFQDTSRVQWDLVGQLVRSWGEGLGASADALHPSIFIVGDRKQSIYGFRDADVAVLDEAASFIAGLREDGEPRRAISVSFRASSSLLAFINDLFDAIEKAPERRDRFRYDEQDRFPTDSGLPDRGEGDEEPALGFIVGDSFASAADRVAEEIRGLLRDGTVRDRATGLRRPARPADVAILFRSRDSHREFERALARRDIGTYVYKGLGFFEADEVQDLVALLKFLADPSSDLRAAAFLRSRLVRLSDPAIAALAPGIAAALGGVEIAAGGSRFSDEDRRVFGRLREDLPRWLALVDRVTASELLTTVLDETGYLYEIRGLGRKQARENMKKLRGMVRRFENRGYATLRRVAEHLDELAVGDESNASIDATDAVSLMTVHAAKGLEFPIVFVVNVNRGIGGVRAPIRVAASAPVDEAVAIADYQSEADEDQKARDREETKRLLYVALTRARDRLYLSAIVKEGACRMTRGSLGEVLPEDFKRIFSEIAGTSSPTAVWKGSRRLHEFVVR